MTHMTLFDRTCLRIYFGLRWLSVLAFNALDKRIDAKRGARNG